MERISEYTNNKLDFFRIRLLECKSNQDKLNFIRNYGIEEIPKGSEDDYYEAFDKKDILTIEKVNYYIDKNGNVVFVVLNIYYRRMLSNTKR